MQAGEFGAWEEELAAFPAPDAFDQLGATSLYQEASPEGLFEASAAGAELYHGKVKTYNAIKGFGFLTSDQIDGDIMFGNQEVPAMLQGQNLSNMLVKFDVKTAAKGMRAAAMQFVVSQAGSIEFSPNFWGTVKRYNPAKGFGFVVAPEAGEGDIIFGAKDLHPMLSHAPLAEMEMGFDMVETEKGRRATNIAVMISSASGGGAGVTLGGAPMMSRGPAMVGSAQSSGKIVSFSAMRGWGFLRMNGSEADAYFQTQNLQDISPEECVAGLDVMCEVELVKGRPQGRHIRRAGGQKRMLGSAWPAIQPMPKRPKLGMPPQQQGSGDTSYGTITTFNAGKGFGFVSCSATGGDAYFKNEHLVGVSPHAITPGTPVMYELVVVNGKAQCRNVQPTGNGPAGPIAPAPMTAKGASPLLGKGAPWPLLARKTGRGGAPAPVQTSAEPVAGIVKSWHAGTYGFMTCSEVEGDVWFGTKSLGPGVAEPMIGDTLSFQLVTKPDGRCAAEDGSVGPLL